MPRQRHFKGNAAETRAQDGSTAPAGRLSKPDDHSQSLSVIGKHPGPGRPCLLPALGGHPRRPGCCVLGVPQPAGPPRHRPAPRGGVCPQDGCSPALALPGSGLPSQRTAHARVRLKPAGRAGCCRSLRKVHLDGHTVGAGRGPRIQPVSSPERPIGVK